MHKNIFLGPCSYAFLRLRWKDQHLLRFPCQLWNYSDMFYIAYMFISPLLSSPLKFSSLDIWSFSLIPFSPNQLSSCVLRFFTSVNATFFLLLRNVNANGNYSRAMSLWPSFILFLTEKCVFGDVTNDDCCVLCARAIETKNHLFFQCCCYLKHVLG